MIISAQIFEAYIKCPYKCRQFCLGEKGEENVFLDFIRMQNDAYRTAGVEKLTVKLQGSEYVALPSAPVDIKMASWRLAIGIVAKKENLESHLHAVEQFPFGYYHNRSNNHEKGYSPRIGTCRLQPRNG